MGTNYYWYPGRKCEECGQSVPPVDEKLHIGKKSAGWVFTLHVIPSLGIYTAQNWYRYMVTHTGTVMDEYGTVFTPNRMLSMILGTVNRARREGYDMFLGYDTATGDFS